MKKLVKWCIILGIICCLIGTGVTTAGVMMGGVDDLRHDVGRRIEAFEPEAHSWDEYVWLDGNAVSEREHAAAEHSALGGEDFSPDSCYLYQNVERVSVEIGDGSAELRVMPELAEREIMLCYDGEGNEYLVKEGGRKLEIEPPRQQERFGRMSALVIGVPEERYLEELDVEVQSGTFYAEWAAAKKLSLETQFGEIRISGGYTEYLDAETESGTIACQAKVQKTASAECADGFINLFLAGEAGDYDYELECGEGSIVLNGEEPEEFSHLHREMNFGSRAGQKVELECQTGKITVDFGNAGI